MTPLEITLTILCSLFLIIILLMWVKLRDYDNAFRSMEQVLLRMQRVLNEDKGKGEKQ